MNSVTVNNNEITLQNDEVKIILLPLGATLYKIFTYDKNGNFENILLTFENKSDYYKSSPYFGMTCGRHAGRIKDGQFRIGSDEFFVTKNDGHNHLHGGINSFSQKEWNYELSHINDTFQCIFSTKSNHHEEGYPGNIDVKVVYSLTGNELKIEYFASTDRPTLLNLTNHAYFNLSGKKREKIYNHSLEINSHKYVSLSSDSLPSSIKNVEGTYFDFKNHKLIGDLGRCNNKEIIKEKGLNHPFVFDKQRTLEISDKTTQRIVCIDTSYPSVVLYSFNYPNSEKLDYKTSSSSHIGLAIECQYVPNAINTKIFEQPITTKSTPYYEWIKYKFLRNA